MGMQMYIVAVKGGVTEASSVEIQRAVRSLGGLILMVTRTGPLVALDNARLPALSKHPLVELVGPVTLNPRGFAAERLERIFAENLSRQLDFGKLAEPQKG